MTYDPEQRADAVERLHNLVKVDHGKCDKLACPISRLWDEDQDEIITAIFGVEVV
jgi:hypothetical protein